jgi:hypothetical protein
MERECLSGVMVKSFGFWKFSVHSNADGFDWSEGIGRVQ